MIEHAPTDDDPILGPWEISRMRRHGEPRAVPAGQQIFSRGEPGETMFVVESGEVRIDFSESKESKSLGDGSFFGELALIIGQHTRSGTVTTVRPTRLLCFSQGTLEALIGSEPAIVFGIVRRTCAYLLSSELGLVRTLERQNAELRRGIDYLRRTRDELDRRDLVSRTDALTGLYNRRCLDDQLAQMVAQALDTGSAFSILALDLDGFKQANDRFGHAFGDEVLRGVAALIRESVRKTDLPCRPGGDEFVMLLPDAELAIATRVAEDIRKRIESTRFIPDGLAEPAPITATIGVAEVRRDDTSQTAMARADANLYEAKRTGRNRTIAL